MNQETPNPFLNALFAILAVGGLGSSIVSHLNQIEQGWRMVNLALGSVASLVAIVYWLRKNKSK